MTPSNSIPPPDSLDGDDDPIDREGQAPEDPIVEAREELAAAQEILNVVTKEHRRISRDLHDTVGQELYGLRLIASNLAMLLRQEGLQYAEAAELIEQTANDAQRMLRRAIKGVFPREVNADGLPKALTRLASYVTDHYAVKCDCSVPEELTLPDHECAGALLKIAQQACQNASKYAKPTRIAIMLKEEADGFRMTVENDGLPIQINDRDSVTGIGLAIMQTRAKVISGTFIIEPLPQGGTRVEVFLPAGRRLGLSAMREK